METIKLIEFFIRSSIFLTAIFGNNWLAVASLPKDRSAIRTNEVLFINLAVSNLITNYVVNLPETITDLAGHWFLGETFCYVFLFSIDFSETSSLFSTFLISAFWHQKLVGSLKRGGAPVQLDNLYLVGLLLLGSWTVCAVFSIHHFFFGSVEGTNGSQKLCVDVFPSHLGEQTFNIIFLSVANVFPLIGIVAASAQIVVTLLQNQKRVGSQASKEVIREDKSSQNKTSGMSLGPLKGVKLVRTYKSESLSSSEVDIDPQTSSQTASNCSVGAPASKSCQIPSKASPNSSIQRAAKSVVAVGSVVLVCWLTHLLLHITNTVHSSHSSLEVAGYITASYSCIIPFILLHGVKKLSCSCKNR
ncbi:C-X-C chemokine receptor type 3 [Oryzias melastigma]|uniref:C-X-C chemokine receptor type 3 n=3 Tax=Oryzias melastigma TaxID=30732 RepID=A0A834CQF5_ORYME|nr:C-X-C chemokine receptor type 3 [Oryzias melastigma]